MEYTNWSPILDNEAGWLENGDSVRPFEEGQIWKVIWDLAKDNARFLMVLL